MDTPCSAELNVYEWVLMRIVREPLTSSHRGPLADRFSHEAKLIGRDSKAESQI